MNLIALDIPESQSDIPTWIESVMCEGDLRALVAQLDAAAEYREPPAEQRDLSLDDLLGDHRQSVLADGLVSLPHDAITSLLSSPSLLPPLQELTMVQGSGYWQKRYTSASGIESELAASRQQVELAIAGSTTIASPVSLPSGSESQPEGGKTLPSNGKTLPSSRDASPVSSQPLRRWMALAATLLLGLGIWLAISSQPNQQQIAEGPTTPPETLGGDGQPVEGIGWGWASDKGVPGDMSGSEYLNALAGGAAAWGKKQPADKAGLVKRLTEFRAGCNRLANMTHPNLPDADEKWLVASCSSWLTEIDGLIDQADRLEFSDLKRQADTLAATMESELSRRSTVS